MKTKKLLFFLFLAVHLVTFSQKKQIQLKEAITLAQKKSPEYQALVNNTQARYWRYRNYIASFLPELSLNLSPRYANSVNRITNDLGQDIFVRQNQSIIDGGLSLRQQVPYTGGIFSINSQLQRIDRFGDNNTTSFSVVPFSIRYFQNSLFYNSFRWDKKIEPLRYEESRRDFVERMEEISLNTCRRYFDLLKAQMQLEIAKRNLSNQDTLLQIAKGRYRIGKIPENDLLQMELRHLNSQNFVTTNTVAYKKASQDLARYLSLNTENIELSIPEELKEFKVSVEKALEEAYDNRKAVIEFRRRRLEMEKELAEAKGNNRVRLSVNANFGLNGQSDEYSTLFQDYDQQQNVNISLGIPIFDWGVSKSKRKMAEANLDLTDTNIKQESQAFEQEIYLHTLNWSNQRSFLSTAEKAQEVALKRYDITKKRYVLGKVSITDLNLAQQEKDKAVIDYLNSLEKFWTDYYLLRKLTLYDFIADQKIKVEELVFD
ncbi:TolC family protein [Flagellimonas pacifica]|uniref:Outer membrane protein TolC n=1 Tax=Flagellimonas pacifica TaxID=1247520 RepID=A0A285N1K6_9FLAO|nr:TolC family protein [Allomuricauda parva]SNZ01896.1 Outer membrane protein TolC [Allomuricauda parva]